MTGSPAWRKSVPLTEAEKQEHIEGLHFACRKVRLAIAVLDADVPPDESTITRLDEAMVLLHDVRNALAETKGAL